LGVEVLLNTNIEQIDENGVLAGGRRIPADGWEAAPEKCGKGRRLLWPE
jgi:hypothetical protein